MSQSRQIVEASWDMLPDTESSNDLSVRERPDIQTPHGGVMLARDSEGTRHVLVPIGPNEHVVSDTESQGIQLVRTSFTDRDALRHFLDIRCPEPRLHRVFNQIASAMLDAIATGKEAPSECCARVLESWRALLRRVAKPLSQAKLRGVFGELWFLSQLAEQGSHAVEYWLGPEGQPQDFISATGAFEVKTTSRHPARRVSINGVDQLDDQLHPFLTLVVVSVASDSKGTSIPELIAHLLELETDREQLLDRLAKVGVLEDDLPEASKLRLRVTSIAVFAITEDFPRIVPRSFDAGIPPGVLDLRYDIDLGSATRYLLDDAKFRERQHEFLGQR